MNCAKENGSPSTAAVCALSSDEPRHHTSGIVVTAGVARISAGTSSER